MIVIFKHLAHDNHWIDAIISVGTNSKYIHSQINFSNGMAGSSWMEFGVTFRTLDNTMIYPFLFDYVDLTNTDIDEQKTFNFMLSQIGKEFSIPGAVMATMFPRLIRNRNKWHCTEIVYAALIYGGLNTEARAAVSVTPGQLFDILQKYPGARVTKGDELFEN